MSDLPVVSVVIPCLNRAHLLGPTIESVLQQDYPQVECIVVDGGSSDGTVEILKSYGERLKWVSEPDGGHADAINKGWHMSKGEILAWLNADDLWVVPDAVSKAVAYLRSHPEVQVVYGECRRIDRSGKLGGMCHSHVWDLAYAVEYCDYCIPQPSAFIRRSILERVNWLDTSFHQKKDHDLWLRIGLVGRIDQIPVLLAYASNHPGLSDNGSSASSACLQVTKKFLELENVPASIREKKRRAMSNACLTALTYAYKGGRHWRLVFWYAVRAAVSDPTNARAAYDHLRKYVAYGARESLLLKLIRVILDLPYSLKRRIGSQP